MSTIMKTTPVDFFQKSLNPKWGEVNNTSVALEFDSAQIEEARKKILGVTDTSCFQRFGVKGPKAADWLAAQDVTVPAEPNTWLSHDQSMVLRLGGSEFLVEDLFSGVVCQQLNEAAKTDLAGVYKVLRADAAFIISGTKRYAMFSELCKLDLSAKEFSEDCLLMTQVADVSATILTQSINGETVFRLWCDGTYGAYMWRVLHQLAQEFGGGAVGFSRYLGNE